MTPPRFLLDEHVPRAIQSKLLRLDAELDILAVGQPLAPPKGTPDPDILTWVVASLQIYSSSRKIYSS